MTERGVGHATLETGNDLGAAFETFVLGDMPAAFVMAGEIVESYGGLDGDEKREAALYALRPFFEVKLTKLLAAHDMPWIPAVLERTLFDPACVKLGLWAFDQVGGKLLDKFVEVAKGASELQTGTTK